MKTSPPQYSFSAGEVSPLLYGRPDYQRTQQGLRTCSGFLPMRQGGFTRAPGTLLRGRTKSDAAARLIAFVFAENDAVTLEFTANVMRVWRYGALVLSGGNPYELVTPYDDAAVAKLKFAQSADVIYLCDGVLAPRKLSRFALDNWTIAAVPFTKGPFQARNLDTSIAITPSATTGAITLTAASAVFVSGHVGGLFEFRVVDQTDPLWTGNTVVAAGERMINDGHTYQVVSGTDTGLNPPVHTEGDVLSEKGKVTWRFVDDGVGIVAIDAVTSATVANATVIKAIPATIVANGTYRWAEGAWSAKNGYPAAVTIYDQRAVYAATPASPRTLWFSTLGLLEDFEPAALADSAFAYNISGTQSLNRILWLETGSRGLHVGALGEEISSRSSTALEAIGALNARFGTDTRVGSKDVQPISPDGKPIIISRGGDRVFELRYAFAQDEIEARELSLPAEHLGAAGFEEIHWQAGTLRQAWIRRGDGSAAILVHDPAEDVLGWARLPVAGGVIESISISPDATGASDVVTMVVNRTVNGGAQRHVEEVAPVWGLLADATPADQAVHLFAATVFTPGSATATFTGLGDLEGETVYAWTDQGELGPVTVSGGAVTLRAAVNRATIGLFDATHLAETLDVVAAARDGATLGRPKRLKGFGVRLHRTGAAEARSAGRSFATADIFGAWQDITQRAVPADLTDATAGVAKLPLQAGWAQETSYQFRPVGGAPMTVLAVVPTVDAGGA